MKIFAKKQLSIKQILFFIISCLFFSCHQAKVNSTYLSDFYITIDPQVHDIQHQEYYLHVIGWVLTIGDFLDMLFKYETNTDYKIQIQKYNNNLMDFLIGVFFYRYMVGKQVNLLNHTIYQNLQQKIFPLVKKTNKIIKNSKKKILIKNMHDLKTYLFNGLLRPKPINLNNYIINIFLIKKTLSQDGYTFIKNAKNFLFYIRHFVQAILDGGKNHMMTGDYNHLQLLLTKIGKTMDQLSKLLLIENLNQINLEVYEKDIESMVEEINNIMAKTTNINTYKIMEKFNNNINTNQNCMEYIPGYYNKNQKNYYNLLILKSKFFFINQYKLNVTYNPNAIYTIMDILKIIEAHEKNPLIQDKIKKIFHRYEQQKSKEIAWKKYQNALEKAQEEARKKTEIMIQEQKLIKKKNKERLKKRKEELLAIQKKKEEERLAIQKKQKEEELLAIQKKKEEERIRQEEEQRLKDVERYDQFQGIPTDQSSGVLNNQDDGNGTIMDPKVNGDNGLTDEKNTDLIHEMDNTGQEDANGESNGDKNKDKNQHEPTTIVIDDKAIEEQLLMEEEAMAKGKKPAPGSYEYAVQNYNKQSMMEYNLNQLKQNIVNESSQFNQILYNDEKSFFMFVEEVNGILKQSTLIIISFIKIIENHQLVPVVLDKINNYYIQNPDGIKNKNFIEILMDLVESNYKKKLIVLLKNLESIIKDKNHQKEENSQRLSSIKTHEKKIFLLKTITINDKKYFNDYLIYINIQIKKIYDMEGPLTKKIPHNINENNVQNLQKTINELTEEDWMFLEKNDIILITYNQYQKIHEIVEEYRKYFLLRDPLLNNLININFQLNEIVSQLSIVYNWAPWIDGIQSFNNIYHSSILPFLKEK